MATLAFIECTHMYLRCIVVYTNSILQYVCQYTNSIPQYVCQYTNSIPQYVCQYTNSIPQYVCQYTTVYHSIPQYTNSIPQYVCQYTTVCVSVYHSNPSVYHIHQYAMYVILSILCVVSHAAVLLVGYGTHKGLFSTKPYWLIKNRQVKLRNSYIGQS